jgi:dienelactone hydrolase
MFEAPGFEAHTVFAPQDLSSFGKKKLLPVMVWGNGACNNSPWEHYKFLNEIASHGFLVIATGHIPMEEVPYNGPRSTSEQQLQSVDWAIAQNADKESPFYGRIDVDAIAAAGMSCGGLQTLDNSADPRFKTLMIMNSGLFTNPAGAMPGMPMPEKDKLQNIKVPVIYILGGEEDIAYGNGMDDFFRLKNVPAVAANLPVGHGGTYRQPHGGEFTVPALAWLQWQLQGNEEAAKMFTGSPCGLALREGWTVDKNGLID